jgi:enoyl-[acyl-carrier protein] reductase II
VNVPLYNPRAAAFLDIVLEEKVPIIVASQGGPSSIWRASRTAA